MIGLDIYSPRECEDSTLYAACQSLTARKEIGATLGPNGGRYFSNPLWRDIYNGIVEFSPCVLGPLEILDWLARTQGGEYSVAQRTSVLNLFADNCLTSTGLYYAQRVVDYGQRRLAMDLAIEIERNADLDPEQQMAIIEAGLKAIKTGGCEPPVSINDMRETIMAERVNVHKSRVLSGFDALDTLTEGLAPGHLMVVGARTGKGKSALAVNFAVSAARDGFGVLFCALEMSAAEITKRIVSVHTGVIPRAEDAPYEAALKKAGELPINIISPKAGTVGDIEAAVIAQRAANRNVGLVVVDYLQLMDATEKTGNRQEAVASVSRALKNLARTAGIPVVVLSQLRRLGDTESGEIEPELHHLRESGAIEQDADFVVLLHWTGVTRSYGHREIQINLAKNRHGPAGKVWLDFDLPTQSMTQRPY